VFEAKVKDISENELYDALKKWINHDSARKKHVDELLEYVNLKCLPKDVSKYYILGCPVEKVAYRMKKRIAYFFFINFNLI
jgi:BTB And C-terminal Kelch